MSVNDIRVVDTAGRSNVATYPDGGWLRDDRTTSSEAAAANPGEPLKQSGTAAQFCVLCADADLTVGTDQPLVGIAAATSTETSSADGKVETIIPLQGMVYEISAKTSTTADTQSEIDVLRGEMHVLDLTSSKFTIDIAAGSGANNAFLIVGGNPNKSTIKFMIRDNATVISRAQV